MNECASPSLPPLLPSLSPLSHPTEAERSLPFLNAKVDALLARLGLAPSAAGGNGNGNGNGGAHGASSPAAGAPPLTMRMTGCPNGCARPYMAELGWVGDGPNSYQVRDEMRMLLGGGGGAVALGGARRGGGQGAGRGPRPSTATRCEMR